MTPDRIFELEIGELRYVDLSELGAWQQAAKDNGFVFEITANPEKYNTVRLRVLDRPAAPPAPPPIAAPSRAYKAPKPIAGERHEQWLERLAATFEEWANQPAEMRIPPEIVAEATATGRPISIRILGNCLTAWLVEPGA